MKTINAVINRFEGDYAVLELDNGAEILWPTDRLPSDIREGNMIRIDISKDIQAEKGLRKSISDIQKKLR